MRSELPHSCFEQAEFYSSGFFFLFIENCFFRASKTVLLFFYPGHGSVGLGGIPLCETLLEPALRGPGPGPSLPRSHCLILTPPFCSHPPPDPPPEPPELSVRPPPFDEIARCGFLYSPSRYRAAIFPAPGRATAECTEKRCPAPAARREEPTGGSVSRG
jgi:hypothetical protein